MQKLIRGESASKVYLACRDSCGQSFSLRTIILTYEVDMNFNRPMTYVTKNYNIIKKYKFNNLRLFKFLI